MLKITLIICLAVVLFVVYIRYVENSTIFYPSKILALSPEDYGLPFEDIYFQTADGLTLHGWYIFADKTRDSARARKATGPVMFFHGNAGNIGDRIEKIDVFLDLGLDVFLFDYRGYGNSEGHPNEEGLYSDGLAAYTYVTSRPGVEKEGIIMYGASLGGAPAIDLASKVPSRAIIIDSSFSSAVDMAKVILPVAPSFLVRSKFDNIMKIQKIASPKFFIHSQHDEVIPYRLGRKLFDAAPGPKVFLDTQGGHNDGHHVDRSSIQKNLEEFFSKY